MYYDLLWSCSCKLYKTAMYFSVASQLQVDPDKSGHVDFPDFLRQGADCWKVVTAYLFDLMYISFLSTLPNLIIWGVSQIISPKYIIFWILIFYNNLPLLGNIFCCICCMLMIWTSNNFLATGLQPQLHHHGIICSEFADFCWNSSRYPK